MSLAPSHASAVAGSNYTTTEAVQIKLPGKTLNLITGASVVRFLVGTTLTTFTGSDPEFGRLGAVGSVGFSMEAQAPVWKMSMLPNSPAAIAALCDPRAQGSVVQFWTLVINRAGGEVINAHRLWKGKIDTQTVTTGQTMRVDLDVVTPTDLLMMQNEGERLTVAWQKLHFNQQGLAFNVDAMEQPFWGIDAIRANPTATNPGSGGGGGFGGGGGGEVSHQFY